MARQLADFITGYLEYTKDIESPTSYNLWCGISSIAAALQRKCYLHWGMSTLYPNIYVVLIGPSGKCRKGEAMGVAVDIIRSVGIKMVAESITREALIKDIRESITSYNDPDKGIQFHCSLTVFSEELAVFLGQGDIKFLADLTDWYNSKDEWTYRTKGQGTDKIQGICFNLVGATAPDWLVSILPQEARGGGFTARVLFIVEENKRAIVPAPFIPDARLRQALINDLEQIHIMAGEMQFHPEALAMYMSWYVKESENSSMKAEKFASYNERRATHIRKLSMICTASRGNNRLIMPEDFERAATILTAAEVKMEKAFKGLGKAKYSESTIMILEFLTQQGRPVTRSEVLKKFYTDVDDYTLDIITKTLAGMKAIKISHDMQNADQVYTLITD